MMEDIRLLAQDLRPPALDTVGLVPAIEGLCRTFGKRTQLSVQFEADDVRDLPDAASTCLYRFLQEALTNVAKHANAHRVQVTLGYREAEVCLSVEDDGSGFASRGGASATDWPTGLGLLGMAERLDALGGRLEVRSRSGYGATVVAHLPIGDTA